MPNTSKSVGQSRYEIAGSLLLCVVVGSGAAALAKKPKPAEAKPAAGESMQIEGTVGEMDAGQVERLFQQHQPDLRRCYDDVSARLHYVGGRLSLKVQVLPSGQPKSVAVTESSFGSREVEGCIVRTVEKLRFPAPKGGEGELTYPFEAAGSRVGSWPGERVATALGKRRQAVMACKGRSGSATVETVQATLYIGPGGRATSVGFAAPAPLDDKLTGCIAKQLLGVQYDDPLGQMVKVAYDLGSLSSP